MRRGRRPWRCFAQQDQRLLDILNLLPDEFSSIQASVILGRPRGSVFSNVLQPLQQMHQIEKVHARRWRKT